MNLLVFEPYPDNRYGGQEKSLFEVCQGLAERGVSITLIGGEDGNLLPRYAEFCRNVIQVTGPFYLQHSNIPNFFKNLIKLFWLSRPNHWDAIYINQYGDAPLAALLGSLLRIPVVAHLRLALGTRLSRQYQFGLRRCAALIPISQFTKQQYIAAGIAPEKLHVIYNGTDLDHYSPVPRSGGAPPKILYLGRLCPSKGIETLIDAFAFITRRRSDVTLTVAGNAIREGQYSTYREVLRDRAVAAGVAVEFLENQADVRPLLGAADLLVLPSNWGEPFGRVLIEAMAMGIPVIATRDGGIPEVLSERFAEHLVPPDEPEALASAILQHIDWRVSNPGLGTEFRRYAESRFSQTLTHEQIMALITGSLEKSTVVSPACAVL